jgi:release factor glutamine methyltransferase
MSHQSEWTVLEALKWCTSYLAEHDDPNPRLSAQWLLSDATALSRTEVYAYHDRPLTAEERTRLRASLKRKGEGEPLQHILGEAPFRHLSLMVTPDVLIPRPETEGLVDLVLEDVARRGGQSAHTLEILDVGTGSGCIALALADECPDVRITAIDISAEALAIAARNAARLNLDDRIEFIESDCFAQVGDRLFDVIVSNPPYVPSAYLSLVEPQVLKHEPRLALDGGIDGLDLFRRMLGEAIEHMYEDGALFVELDESNATQAAELAVQLNRYASVVVARDLNERDRYVAAVGFETRGSPS